MHLGRVLDPALAHVPDRVALVVDDRPCTFAELDQAVRRVAATLAARGVGPGARVALVDNGSVLSVATMLAAAPQMNVLLHPSQLGQLVAAVGATVGVAGEPFRPKLAEALGADAVFGEGDLVATDGADGAGVVDVAPGDEALVLFTSGTTGL